MFGFKPRQFTDPDMPLPRIPMIERLEDRQLLSATVHHAHATAVHAAAAHKAVHAAKTHTKAVKTSHKKAKNSGSATNTTSTAGPTGLPNIPVGLGGFGGKVENAIEFSQAPSAVQSGLTSLASTDSQAAPTSDQTVYLGNSNGVETYSLHYATTGTATTITVDQNGNAVTKPTDSTTTFADLTSSDSAAASEISAIASALDLTAPTDTTTVNVVTASGGAITYSVHLAPIGATAVPVASSTAAIGILPGGPIAFAAGGEISVDASGNPVGNQRLPFSVLPAGIQSAINANVPSGASALASSSTQSVDVRTIDGITLYTTTFDSTGTTSTITVNSSGTLVSLPTTTTADFSTIPQPAQAELQTLATADGITTAIASTQSVTVYTEANGTVIYAVSLANSSSTSTTNSDSGYGDFVSTITIAVDAAGNSTVPPNAGFGGFGGGGGFGPGGAGGPIPVAFAEA